MLLIEVTVNKFRSIVDSSPVRVERDITCMVGKNESGKTSFLHALYRLNPARPNVKFKLEDQYPAWLEKRDRMKGHDLPNFKPITAKFQFEQDLTDKLNETFGQGVLKENTLILSRTYNDKLSYSFSVDHKAALLDLRKDLRFTEEVTDELTRSEIADVQTLKKVAAALTFDEENVGDKEAVQTLLARIKTLYGDNTLEDAIWGKVQSKVPTFIYFDKYSSLPYRVKVKYLLKTDKAQLKDDELTARALLTMAGAEDEYLLNPDYERRKRELENVANALTEDVLKYWSQNRELRVAPDIQLETVPTQHGQTTAVDELKIRIWDNKHFLSLPFNEHSTGFQWFFSFLAAFSEYEYRNDPVIILLDEPGLGLHGRAQADFLKFIEERLADKRQVIYTTHSPFLVQPNRLERARIVEEKNRDEGTKVTEDVFTTDPDTLFPLQGALGYDLVQHLFVAKNNVILEGTSDFVYLTVMSDFLREQGKKSLNEKWSLIPVGGADLIPTFAALLGNHLDVTILLDARKEGNQKLSNLAAKGYLKGKRIITIGEIVGRKLADIEDLFEEGDYLTIYNETFGTTHRVAELQGTDQIVSKIARRENVERFDHGKPADYFLRNKLDILPKLSATSLVNFEALIERINNTFDS
jgi:predicted ATP-dependent endonuclease of OLD family